MSSGTGRDPKHITTLDRTNTTASVGGAVALCLTIAHHPDPTRVGQRAVFSAKRSTTRVSRLTPKFGHRRGGDTAPIEDPHVSRQPLFLEGSLEEGLDLGVGPEASLVTVHGVAVRDSRHFTPAEIEDGVVLEIAESVVVVLHTTTPLADVSNDDLGIVGESDAMHQLRQRIRRVAPHDVTVLIRGESGTGKELVARAIHDLSSRADEEFVGVNMAAVPASTAASALFGHARGAFTGAVRAATGYFGRAHQGTLFLDEIGDTPLDVQASLLRALETGEIQAVGEEAMRHADVRLVAATDADLDRAVQEGSFRQALLQRLGGYVLEVPPLRARREDVGLLLIHFLAEELERVGRRDRLCAPTAGARPWVPSWLVALAAGHAWQGNVRELRNATRQIAIDWADAAEVRPTNAVRRLFGGRDAPPPTPSHESPHEAAGAAAHLRVAEVTEEILQEALEAHGWQPAATAAALGMSRTSIYALMHKMGLRLAADLTAEEIDACLAECDGDTARAAERFRVSEQALKRQMKVLGLR